MFACTPEGGEGGSRADIQAEKVASAKAPRPELSGLFVEQGRAGQEGWTEWGLVWGHRDSGFHSAGGRWGRRRASSRGAAWMFQQSRCGAVLMTGSGVGMRVVAGRLLEVARVRAVRGGQLPGGGWSRVDQIPWPVGCRAEGEEVKEGCQVGA